MWFGELLAYHPEASLHCAPLVDWRIILRGLANYFACSLPLCSAEK